MPAARPSPLSACQPAWGVPVGTPPVQGWWLYPSPLSRLVPQVLHDCQRHRSNIREIGDLWVGAGSEHGGLSTLPGVPSRKSSLGPARGSVPCMWGRANGRSPQMGVWSLLSLRAEVMTLSGATVGAVERP